MRRNVIVFGASGNCQENCRFLLAIVKDPKIRLDSSYRAMQDISQ
jgi:hypothetical protein